MPSSGSRRRRSSVLDLRQEGAHRARLSSEEQGESEASKWFSEGARGRTSRCTHALLREPRELPARRQGDVRLHPSAVTPCATTNGVGRFHQTQASDRAQQLCCLGGRTWSRPDDHSKQIAARALRLYCTSANQCWNSARASNLESYQEARDLRNPQRCQRTISEQLQHTIP